MTVTRTLFQRGTSTAMRWFVASLAALVAVVLSPLGTPSGATTASGTPIAVGFVYPATGSLAASYLNAPDGLAAYFNAINKEGGYHGHPIKLITEDDQSTATGAQTAVNLLLSDNVTFIVNGSPFFFTIAKTVQEKGIPVIGALTDGPEWGEQPYTNMFDLRGGISPQHVGVGDVVGVPFFKYIGAKKLGGLAIGISPSAIATAQAIASVATSSGLDVAFENFNVPYGPYEPTTDILQMKGAGVQGVYCVCGASTYSALITNLRNESVKIHPLSFGGVDYTLFQSPTTSAAVQGAYYNSYFPPPDSNATAQLAEQRLAKTVPGFKVGQIPSYTVSGAYNSAQLVDKGLQLTGKSDPTPQEIIASLQKLKNWNADGLLPSPVSFTHFGTSEPKYCSWFVKGEGKGFVFLNGGKQLCVTTPANLR